MVRAVGCGGVVLGLTLGVIVSMIGAWDIVVVIQQRLLCPIGVSLEAIGFRGVEMGRDGFVDHMLR